MKKYKVLCPLSNFRVQTAFRIPVGMSDEEARKLAIERSNQLIEGIELFNGIRMRRISKEDLEDFSVYHHLFSPAALSIHAGMFILEKHITDEDKEYSKIYEIMLNVVLGLRLLKKGGVMGNAVFNILLSDKRQLTSMHGEEESIPQFPGLEYVLEFDDVPALKSLLVKIQEIDFAKRGSLHLACKRLQRTYGESDAEDKLIDLMIAFEALFLKGEKVGASSGQIVAVACSHLLGKNDEERDKIRYSLTNAYSIRNRIVHGSAYVPVIKDNMIVNDLSDIVSEIEDYLREAIKKLL